MTRDSSTRVGLDVDDDDHDDDDDARDGVARFDARARVETRRERARTVEGDGGGETSTRAIGADDDATRGGETRRARAGERYR